MEQQHRGSVVSEICSLYDRMSESEKQIADFMMANLGDVAAMTTREIASRSETSPATVSRFVRHLGFESFLELCDALLREDAGLQGGKMDFAAVGLDNPRAALGTVLSIKERELRDTMGLINDDALVRAVRLMERADLIMFAAVGNTIPSALSASFMLSQLGLRVHCAPTTDAMTVESLSLTDRDVIMFLSKSGHSKRLNKMMDNAIASNTPSVVVTGVVDSPLASRASCVLRAATLDKMLNASLPFSHNSINYVMEVLFLLLCSEVPNFKARAGVLWQSLGDDKGVSGEVF